MRNGSFCVVTLLLGAAACTSPHNVIVDAAHNGLFPRPTPAEVYLIPAGPSLIIGFGGREFTVPPGVPMPAGVTAPNSAEFMLAGKGYSVQIEAGATQVVISAITVRPWKPSSNFAGFQPGDTFFVQLVYLRGANEAYPFWGGAFRVGP